MENIRYEEIKSRLFPTQSRNNKSYQVISKTEKKFICLKYLIMFSPKIIQEEFNQKSIEELFAIFNDYSFSFTKAFTKENQLEIIKNINLELKLFEYITKESLYNFRKIHKAYSVFNINKIKSEKEAKEFIGNNNIQKTEINFLVSNFVESINPKTFRQDFAYDYKNIEDLQTKCIEEWDSKQTINIILDNIGNIFKSAQKKFFNELNLQKEKLFNSLKNLKRDNTKFWRETGKTTLKLGYPIISSNTNGVKFRAPMFYFDLSINSDTKTQNKIDININNATMNWTPLAIWANKNDKPLIFNSEIKDLPGAFKTYRNHNFPIEYESCKLKKIEWSEPTETIENIGVIRQYKTFGHKMLENFLSIPKAQITEILKTKNDLRFNADKALKETNIDDIKIFSPLDESQQAAVKKAMEGSVVIQGPPGTGKSQVILNILLNLAYEGKKCLFVSGKKAAIDVIHERLGELKPLSLYFTTNTNKTNSVFWDQFTNFKRFFSKYEHSKSTIHKNSFEEFQNILKSNRKLSKKFKSLSQELCSIKASEINHRIIKDLILVNQNEISKHKNKIKDFILMIYRNKIDLENLRKKLERDIEKSNKQITEIEKKLQLNENQEELKKLETYKKEIEKNNIINVDIINIKEKFKNKFKL